MRYFRTTGESVIVQYDGDLYDVSSVSNNIRGFIDVLHGAYLADMSIEELSEKLISRAASVPEPLEELHLATPLVPSEVWAAGVTYKVSEIARKDESGMDEVYLDVYEGDRPELFFKATPDRIVGPSDDVGIRGDSDWNVPEPELGLVLFNGTTVGYTIGNDMSSRSIEGSNPLFLPQAKVYNRCCSIGPCVVSRSDIPDPEDLELSMTIERDGEIVFDGTTSTDEMVRTCEELVSYYRRHNHVPELTVLLTGTSLVPPNDFTLSAGDQITINIEGIGTLRNRVRVV